MKHTLLYIIPVLAALFGFAACSSDNDITGGEDILTGNAVIINATVGSGSVFTRSNPVGTEDEQKAFTNGDQINVSDGTKAVTYTYNSDTKVWNAPSGEYLTWHSTPVTFNAYYPVSVNGTNNSFTVGNILSNQSGDDGIKASDYMKATETDSKETNDHTINLTFERQTARVVVHVSGYNNQYDASTTTVEGVKVYSQLTVPASGAYSAITTYKSGDDYYALVAPSATANDGQQFLSIDVKTTADGTEKTETKTVTGIPAMEAGKSYTYNITVGKDVATITDVSVSEWGDGQAIPGGEAKLPPLQSVTTADLGKVVTSDGNIYSTVSEAQTAGETAVAMIAYVGSETGNTTYNTGIAIALQDGADESITISDAISKASSFTPNAPSNSSGWHVPSLDEWNRMFSACGGFDFPTNIDSGTKKVSSDGLRSKITSCGATDFKSEQYYSNTTKVVGTYTYYWRYDFSSGDWQSYQEWRMAYPRYSFAF